MATATPKYLRDDVLELMGFVDDRQFGLRDDFTEFPSSHRGIRAEQVVIDDDDLSLGGAVAHAGDEAVGVTRAFASEALLARGGHVGPQG